MSRVTSFLAYTGETDAKGRPKSYFVPEKDLTKDMPHGAVKVPLRGYAFVEAVTVADVCVGFATKEKAA
jgi:hypothetical protein